MILLLMSGYCVVCSVQAGGILIMSESSWTPVFEIEFWYVWMCLVSKVSNAKDGMAIDTKLA